MFCSVKKKKNNKKKTGLGAEPAAISQTGKVFAALN